MSAVKLDTCPKLQKYIDDFIKHNPTHTSLILNNHGITFMSMGDGSCRLKFPESITYIMLTHTNIISLVGVTLPPRLITLQVGWNKIGTLNGVIFPDTMTRLDIENNQIYTLSSAKLPSRLTTLNVSGNRIASLKGTRFPPGLVNLDLSNNNITSFARMQFPLSLLNLNLAGNLIDTKTITELENPSPFVIRAIVEAFPDTGEHFKRMDVIRMKQVEPIQAMIDERKTKEYKEYEKFPKFSVTIPSGVTYEVPLIPDKTVQWVIDYLNETYALSNLVNCYTIQLYNNSTLLEPLRTLEESGITDKSNIFIDGYCFDTSMKGTSMKGTSMKGGRKNKKMNRKSRPRTRKHKWSLKYKRSINCKHPKGFSQRQHCKYGRKNLTNKR